MKKFKKILASALLVAMMASLTACGGSAESESSSSETVVAEDGKPTITFMATSFYGTDLANENSDKVIEAYEEYTGIHVDWKWEADDTYNEN